MVEKIGDILKNYESRAPALNNLGDSKKNCSSQLIFPSQLQACLRKWLAWKSSTQYFMIWNGMSCDFPKVSLRRNSKIFLVERLQITLDFRRKNTLPAMQFQSLMKTTNTGTQINKSKFHLRKSRNS